jgi:Predicted membrane protein
MMIDTSQEKYKFNIYVFFIVIAAVWGLAMSILIPVSQVPDEYTHFDGMLQSYGAGNLLKDDLNDFFRPSGMDSMNSGELHPVDSSAYLDAGMKSYKSGLFSYGFGPGIIAIKYLPQAIGFFLGVLLGLPMLICHQLGELTALIFYVIICTIALKKMPFKKEVMLFVMLMPMALQEAGSFSPDVTVNACSFLLTAMIFDFKIRGSRFDSEDGKTDLKKSKIGWKDMIIFAFLTFIVLISKEIYILIAFGIFIVPLDRFYLPIGKKFDLAAFIKKYKIAFIGLLAAIVIILGILCRDFLYVKVLYACILQPGRTFLLFKNSLIGYKDFYLQTLVGFFGWLDSAVSYFYIVIFFMMLTYINLFQSKKSIELQKDFSIRNRIYLIVLSLAIFVFVFISMVSWSFQLAGVDMSLGVPEFRQYLYQVDYMLGVQGRYFIPFLPMLVISFGRGNEPASSKKYTAVQAVYYILSMLIVLRIIFIRYWV